MTKHSHVLRTAITIFASIFVLAFFIDLLLVIFAGAYTSSRFFQHVITPITSFGIAYLVWRGHKAMYGKHGLDKDSK